MDQVFRDAPTWHGHLQGPFASQRTPGLAYQLDSDTAAPSGFYRSIVGDLALRASAVTGAPPSPHRREPGGLRRCPARPRSSRRAASGCSTRWRRPQDPAATAATTLPDGDAAAADRARPRPRPTARGSSRCTELGTSTSGFVRATGLAPRDSAPHRDAGPSTGARPPVARTATAPTTSSWSPRGSPSGSPRRSRSGTRAGNTVRSRPSTATSSASPGTSRNDAGNAVKDGAYTWTLRAKDAWGNAGTSASGGVHARRDPARVHRQPAFDGRPRRLEASRRSTWRSAPRTRCPGSGRSAAGSRAALSKAYAGGLTITAQRHHDARLPRHRQGRHPRALGTSHAPDRHPRPDDLGGRERAGRRRARAPGAAR